MPESPRTKTINRVTPAAVAAWLHAQGQEPSEHVRAWFDAKGVAWPPEQGVAGAALLVNASPASLAAGDVHDLDTLVRYRLQFKGVPAQQRPAWLPEHVAILRAAINAHGRGGKAALAKRLDMSAHGLSDLLKRHPESVKQQANPWGGLGTQTKAA